MSRSNWQKSSYSGASNECVEVRAADSQVELRESDAPATILRTTPTTFAKLLQAAKAGAFDHHAAPTP
ncbi:DUF397 domain-containing protein [Streptomyces sp. CB01881]|uniref:DUF397 domain-containing protein n=1 Tax=Streptomyces sp. CB01881 TaxID=2078691 RepID=UPI000CDBDE0E|nr:DUF397 domain-containing protein [Streptomyces sp. CB01881]AUY49429.1 DUF397 domain-containing protein [Streptomyces sp. CB01881]TYC72813.1 DUF397 domain-containing protein [Streptomyces sp. CB01881]